LKSRSIVFGIIFSSLSIVHQSEIQGDGFRSLAEGSQVEYDTSVEQGRTKAIRVTGPGGVPVQPSNTMGGGGGRGRGRGS